jgi:hypothetical protein
VKSARRFALDSAELGAWDMDPVNETVVTWDDRCNVMHGFKQGEVPTVYKDIAQSIYTLMTCNYRQKG